MSQQVDLATYTEEALVSARKRVSAYGPLTLTQMTHFVLVAEEILTRSPARKGIPPEIGAMILWLCLTPPSPEVFKELRGDPKLPGF